MAGWTPLILILGMIGGLIGGMWMIFYEDPRFYGYNSNYNSKSARKEGRINTWGCVVEAVGVVCMFVFAAYTQGAYPPC